MEQKILKVVYTLGVPYGLGELDATDTIPLENLPSHTHSYQAADGDLLAIGGLVGSAGLLRKTAVDTWALDTVAYAALAGSSTQDFAVKALTANGATINGDTYLKQGAYQLAFYNEDKNNWSYIKNTVATGSTSSDLAFGTGSGTAQTITHSGNVLIGATLDNGSGAKLQVNGNITLGASARAITDTNLGYGATYKCLSLYKTGNNELALNIDPLSVTGGSFGGGGAGVFMRSGTVFSCPNAGGMDWVAPLTLSNTGIAVQGGISATGSLELSSGSTNHAIKDGRILGWTTTGLTSGTASGGIWAQTNSVHITQGAGYADVGVFSSTGLAVTGGISASGTVRTTGGSTAMVANNAVAICTLPAGFHIISGIFPGGGSVDYSVSATVFSDGSVATLHNYRNSIGLTITTSGSTVYFTCALSVGVNWNYLSL